MPGCNSHHCVIEKPQGLGTNGPCHCLRPLGSENERLVKQALRSLEFYRLRVERLQAHLQEFPEPYRALLANILANGKMAP